MAEQAKNADSIFWAAMEMEVSERVAYLDEACGINVALEQLTQGADGNSRNQERPHYREQGGRC